MSKEPFAIQTDSTRSNGIGSPLGFFAVLWALAAIALSVLAWTLATPLIAAPDESDQVAQAAAVVRGQFDGPDRTTPVGEIARVRVPAWVESAAAVSHCFAFQPHVSAGCAPKIGTGLTTVNSVTQFSNYPPLYFLITGIPTLIWAGSGAIYAMRLTSGLLNAALIALGLLLLARYHPRRLPLLGALVAITPTVLFMSAVVNASGLEIAAAFAAWCSGLALIEQAKPPGPLIAGASVSFALLILSRPISPINAAVILVVLATLAGWDRTRTLLGQKAGHLLAGVIVVAVVVAGITLAVGGPPNLLGTPERPPLSLPDSLWLTLRWTQHRLRQCIGQFGWLDVSAPLLVFVVWLTALGGLGAFALSVSRRCRRALPLLALAILVMPLIFESPQINRVSTYWQGRYWLPLAVGLPLVAATAFPRPQRHQVRRTFSLRLSALGVVIIGGSLAVAQLAAFLTALHRNQTGTGAPPGSPVHWVPPGGVVVAVTLLLVGQALLLAFVTWMWARRRSAVMIEPAPAGDPGGSESGPMALVS